MTRKLARSLRYLSLAGLCLASSSTEALHYREGVAEHLENKYARGEAGAPAAEGIKGKNEGTSPSTQRQEKPLNGFFDLNTLRATDRIAQYRYDLKDIVQTYNQDTPWQVKFSCAIEFGAESGMVEIARKETAVREEIQRILERMQPTELLQAFGKQRLKEEIISAVSRQLVTVRARQVYLTDFLIVK
jgi:hypothetical protein